MNVRATIYLLPLNLFVSHSSFSPKRVTFTQHHPKWNANTKWKQSVFVLGAVLERLWITRPAHSRVVGYDSVLLEWTWRECINTQKEHRDGRFFSCVPSLIQYAAARNLSIVTTVLTCMMLRTCQQIAFLHGNSSSDFRSHASRTVRAQWDLICSRVRSMSAVIKIIVDTAVPNPRSHRLQRHYLQSNWCARTFCANYPTTPLCVVHPIIKFYENI